MSTTVNLVTIIAEGVLRERLIEDLQKLGSRGYTISEVSGHGTRGISEQFWQGHQVKIETLVNAAVADQILDYLHAHYFTDYSVIAYAFEVRVVRGDKYV